MQAKFSDEPACAVLRCIRVQVPAFFVVVQRFENWRASKKVVKAEKVAEVK
ncbi:hypothetical protein JJB98_08765 [Bradyrhizobium diazoefficiens]|nr:hypothetical protein [Bradyrhizobium diazoefficiens]QQO19993.1 hypothetical protein JJB98_08765 [Bradyrhizobium diazoefficiens]